MVGLCYYLFSPSNYFDSVADVDSDFVFVSIFFTKFYRTFFIKQI